MLDEINSYKENDKNYQGNYMFPMTILDKFKVMMKK